MAQPVTDIMVLFGDKQIPLKTVLRSFVAELVPVLRSELENPNEVISQNKAYKQFGQANVMRWVKEKRLMPVAKRPGKIEYRVSDLRICQSRFQDYI